MSKYTDDLLTVEQLDNMIEANKPIKPILPKPPRKPLKHKHEVKPHYFDKIDTEYKAYFLGLLYTDGCNTNNRIEIALQERDGEVLTQISKDVFVTEKPLRFIKRHQPHHQNKLALEIYDKIVAKQLDGHGVIPRKSLALQYPSEQTLPKELFRHFLRGVFDGDGCFINTDKTTQWNVVSASYSFITELKKHIEVLLKDNCVKRGISISKKKPKNPKHHILYSANTNCVSTLFKLYELLYTNTNVYLKRKRRHFDTYILDNYNYKLNENGKNWIKKDS